MPLAHLFEVRQNSPVYTDPAASSLFYGESWALVHYLMIGSPERAKQLGGFLNRVSAGIPTADALHATFGIDTQTLEKELRQYLRRPALPSLTVDFDEVVAGESLRTSETMTEAEVEATLGNVLLGQGRLDEAEPRLDRASRLDPGLGQAYTSLGWLRLRRDWESEALAAFETGAELSPNDFAALSGLGAAVARVESRHAGSGTLHPATREKARQALERALSLVPDDPGALTDLGYLHLVDQLDLAKARTLLERAMAATPDDTRPRLVLAQVRLAQDDLAAARVLLFPLTSDALSESARTVARDILERIDAIESRRREAGTPPTAPGVETVVPRGLSTGALEESPAGALRIGVTGSLDSEFVAGRLESTGTLIGYQLPPLGTVEVRSVGDLLGIECPRGAPVLVSVRTADRSLRLTAASMAAIDFVSFTSHQGGAIACGPRHQPERVVVSWRPGAGRPGPESHAGALVSVAFVPKDWVPIRQR